MRSSKPWAFALAFLLSPICGAVALAQPPAGAADQAQGAAWSTGAVASTCACIAVAALLYLAVKVAIMVFVYRDAKARGADPMMWLVLCFFIDLIGLIIWLVVRPQSPPPSEGTF